MIFKIFKSFIDLVLPKNVYNQLINFNNKLSDNFLLKIEII
jgi:hypothetical protein